MRSKLFVPGIRPDLFAKALASDADAISLDLEDAVPELRKGEARALVAAFLNSDAARTSTQLLIVRVNAVGSPHFKEDLRSLMGTAALGMINVPKVESAAEVVAAADALDAIELALGMTAPMPVLVTIETPRGLSCAGEIATASARVCGLQLGLGDLFEPHGIARSERANVHAAMFTLRLAAAEAGVFAYDGAFSNVGDDAGFQAEARIARALGFIGKSCIHPSQIASANAVFQPSAAEMAQAQRVLTAADEAAARGQSAFLVDGRMIDPPYLRRAQQIIAAGSAAAQMPSGSHTE